MLQLLHVTTVAIVGLEIRNCSSFIWNSKFTFQFYCSVGEFLLQVFAF